MDRVLHKWSVLMTVQLRADARRKARELGLWPGATDAELARFCFAVVAGYEDPLESARVRGGRPPVTRQAVDA